MGFVVLMTIALIRSSFISRRVICLNLNKVSPKRWLPFNMPKRSLSQRAEIFNFVICTLHQILLQRSSQGGWDWWTINTDMWDGGITSNPNYSHYRVYFVPRGSLKRRETCSTHGEDKCVVSFSWRTCREETALNTWNYPRSRPWRPTWLWHVKDLTLSRQ
jgi:hypothetical protein